MRRVCLQKHTQTLLFLFVVTHVTPKYLNFVNIADAGSNEHYSYNYRRDNNGRIRPTTPTYRLFDNDNDGDIATSIMNSESSIRSTVLLHNKDDSESFHNDGRRKFRGIVHDDDIAVDDDLIIRYQNRHTPNKAEFPSSGFASSRSSKQLNLAWRSEPPEGVIMSDDRRNSNNNNANAEETVPWYQNKLTKTGTTIVGVSGNGYCILGADSRATSGTMVADKYCHKLHPLSVNCAAAGAGTSADLDHITRECYYQAQLWLSSSIASRRLQTVGNHPGTTINTTSTMTMLPQISVQQICRYLQQRLLEQRGTCQANLIVGGMDSATNGGDGRRGILRAIHPHGSIDVVSYTALGSGSYAAMGVLERAIHNHTSFHNHDGLQQVHHNLTINEAIALVVKAVKAGIDHDLGSGSQADLCIITSNGIANYTRCYLPEEKYTTSNDDDLTRHVEQDYDNSLTNRTIVKSRSNFPITGSDVVRPRSTKSFQNIGINGFGNVPYVVRSKRTHYPRNNNDNDNHIAILERWKDIIPAY